MKNKHLVLIIMALFFLELIPLWIFRFDFSLKSVIVLCLSGLLVGLLINAINKFAIPSKWAFKHRFGINGVTVLLFYVLLISPLWSGHAISFQPLLIGSILGFFIVGFILKSNYTTVLSKKSFDRSLLDDELISDFCSVKESGKMTVGVLILTNKKRLIFMPVDSEKPLFDLDLLEQKNVTLQKQIGLPNRLIINENINVSVSYPLLWLKEINARP